MDPYLQVEVKPSIRLRKAQEEKMRRIAQKEEYWKRKDMEEHRLREEMRYSLLCSLCRNVSSILLQT